MSVRGAGTTTTVINKIKKLFPPERRWGCALIMTRRSGSLRQTPSVCAGACAHARRGDAARRRSRARGARGEQGGPAVAMRTHTLLQCAREEVACVPERLLPCLVHPYDLPSSQHESTTKHDEMLAAQETPSRRCGRVLTAQEGAPTPLLPLLTPSTRERWRANQ